MRQKTNRIIFYTTSLFDMASIWEFHLNFLSISYSIFWFHLLRHTTAGKYNDSIVENGAQYSVFYHVGTLKTIKLLAPAHFSSFVVIVLPFYVVYVCQAPLKINA